MKKKRFSLNMPAGYNKPIHAAVLLLNFFGVIMVISASMSPKNTVNDLLFAGVKELGFVVIAYVMMVMTARYFSMDLFKKYYRILLILVFGSLLVTPLFGDVGGAYAWIRIGPITIQPSEFAKVFVICMIALKLGDKQRKQVSNAWDLIKSPLIVVLAMVVIIVVLQKDLGSAVVLLGIAYICMLIPSHSKLTRLHKWMFGILFFGILAIAFIDTPVGQKFVDTIFSTLKLKTYMLERFKSAANPFADRYGYPYQIFMGLVAMRQGLEAGFFGKGYGNSINKHGYLPEAQTDFILAIVVEELGVLGIAIVLIGYGTILYQLMKYSLLTSTQQEKIILFGAIAYITLHFVFNVGGATALIPLTGVPLLFLSAGGSSRMAIMIAIGLTQHVISRHKINEKIKEKRMETQSV